MQKQYTTRTNKVQRPLRKQDWQIRLTEEHQKAREAVRVNEDNRRWAVSVGINPNDVDAILA